MALSLLFALPQFCASAFANATDAMLEILVVNPPKPMNWSSPKGLLKTTLNNALTGDPAPNGHLIVHFVAAKPNQYGVQEILTGMSRTQKMKTLITSLSKGLGLSSMVYEFSGQLDSSADAEEELEKRKIKDRITNIRVSLSDEKSDLVMSALEKWIKYGSYLHYGGGKNVSKGEGSGCSDFAIYLLSLALDQNIPFDEWTRKVYLPKRLMRLSPTGENMRKRVTMYELKKYGTEWATSSEEGMYFEIPDPEKITQWFQDGNRLESVSKSLIDSNFTSEFDETQYPAQDEETIRAVWEKIKI